MKKLYSVELHLDPVSERRVRRCWKGLSRLGSMVPSDLGCRPHVTLAVFRRVDEGATARVLRGLAAKRRVLPAVFDSVGTFSGYGTTMFLAPVVTDDLLEIHRVFYGAGSRAGRPARMEYSPGRWVPHCTLALNMDRSLYLRAARWAAGRPMPFRGRFNRIVLCEYPPGRVVASARFR